jgi:hypothetical protein
MRVCVCTCACACACACHTQVGDTVPLTLIRDGTPREVSLSLGVPARLIPLHLAGRQPQVGRLACLLKERGGQDRKARGEWRRDA